MYEGFNEQAKKAMEIAEQEARKQRDEYLGTQHVFFGILKGEGIGSQAIRNFGVNIDGLIERMRTIYSKCEFDEPKEFSGVTPRVKRLLELAGKYSQKLNQDFVGTGHLLYASLAEKFGCPEMLLMDNRINVDNMKKELTSLLATGKSSLPSVILDSSGRPYMRE